MRLLLKIATFTIILLLVIISWLVSEFATADAIAMGVGVLFGVMAGIPTTILLITHERRNKRTPPQQELRAYQIVSTDTGEVAPYILKPISTKGALAHGQAVRNQIAQHGVDHPQRTG